MNKMTSYSVAKKSRRTSGWKIRGDVDTRLGWLLTATGLLLPLIVWLLALVFLNESPIFLPSPISVVQTAVHWVQTKSYWYDVGISLYRVTGGFLLSAVIALPLGVYAGSFRPVSLFVEPLMDFLRYMPAVAFIPLLLLWAGIGDLTKMLVIFIGTFFQQVLMFADNVKQVPISQIEAAQTMGASKREVLRLVIWPSALPALLDTFRITLGWAWTYLVVAEMVASNNGIGYAILRGQRFLQTDKIFVGIITIGLLGLIQDQALRKLHARWFPWLHK